MECKILGWDRDMPRRIRGANIRRQKNFLREWREHRFPDQSLEEVAGMLDMSGAQLSRIERGQSPFTEDFLDVAAALYRTDRISLLTRKPGANDEMWALWGRAKPDQRATITEIVRSLMKSRV